MGAFPETSGSNDSLDGFTSSAEDDVQPRSSHRVKLDIFTRFRKSALLFELLRSFNISLGNLRNLA